MDSAIVRMIFIGLSVAAAAAVGILLWVMLGANSPSTDRDDNIEWDRIKKQELCENLRGTWTAASSKCTKPSS